MSGSPQLPSPDPTSEHAMDPASARLVRRAAWAVFAVFFANGFTFANWAARLPAVRDELGYGEAQMGVLLLTAAVGSLLALPLSGLVVQRLGTVRSIVLFGLVAACGLGLAAGGGLGWGSVPVVRVGLFVFGIGIGVWDAAMNIEGAVVEQRLGRAIMPRFHAGFSFGTMAGAGSAALAAWAGVPVTWHIPVAVTLSLAGVLAALRAFLPASSAATLPPLAGDVPPGSSPGWGLLAAWRERRTLLIGLVVLAAALTEGAANDWVSLAVVDGFGLDDAAGAIALALFLSAMTGMRLLGTALIDRHGRLVMVRVSGVLALIGLVLFGTAPVLWLALVGVVLWGLGAAIGFPVGMSAASDAPDRAPLRVSVVSTIAYSAFFLGPPLIGLLAEHVGYRHALLAIAAPLVAGLLVAPAVRPLPGAIGGDVVGRSRRDRRGAGRGATVEG